MNPYKEIYRISMDITGFGTPNGPKAIYKLDTGLGPVLAFTENELNTLIKNFVAMVDEARRAGVTEK